MDKIKFVTEVYNCMECPYRAVKAYICEAPGVGSEEGNNLFDENHIWLTTCPFKGKKVKQ